jgi:glycosyltransferase involved in cell wall biosynthesis
LGLLEDVVFFGKLRSPAEVLSCSDLFLLPSEHESFGLAALEAMACSVPVISTNRGGLAELNLHGVSGFVSELGDVEDMATNGAQALASADGLERLRVGARNRAAEFAVDEIVPRYEALYNEVAGVLVN